MKTITFLFSIILVFTGFYSFAQINLQPALQNYRLPGYRCLNVFEPPQEDTVAFDGVKVRVGGNFAMQFQGINQTNGNPEDTLVDLGSNFNLPTANLNFDVQLADGMRVHLRTYLSSRHHEESWVKGGHILIDKLDFIEEGFLSGLMDVVTLKVGLDEINYGDAHFRRSDNAEAIYNPFVGNYIMDAFSTEAFGEVYLRNRSWLLMLAVSNGKLNQSVVKTPGADNNVSFYGKIGYDNQLTEDFRLRLTASMYINHGDIRKFIYAGDRAGARYYNVMQKLSASANDFSGRFNPGFNELTAIQINPFIKYQGLEFFGILEFANGGEADGDGSYTQTAAELLYRFGSQEHMYIGGRYNGVLGNDEDGSPNKKINRFNLGGGWFLTNNVLTKLEYVNQSYSGDGWNGTVFQGGEFKGVVIEAVISF